MTNAKRTKLYGLLGKNIDYSFSRGYFTKKFSELNLEHHSYINFDINKIDAFSQILETHSNLVGMNVTIPYKEKIIPLLDEIDEAAYKIGAVNTIQFSKSGKLKGFNTDVIGFKKSLEKLLEKHHKKALVLGTGGASKAIVYALDSLHIESIVVSRNPSLENQISYESVDENVINSSTIIINCTPLGTFPNIERCPNIPYDYITKKHLLYDLIYNPEETAFLSKGKRNGAIVKNGLEMLEIQAEEAWKIWSP